MSLGRSSRFYFLGLAKMKSEKCYLPVHLHHPSSFIMVASCVARILDTDVGKTLMNMEMQIQRKITLSQISPQRDQGNKNLDDRPRDIQHSASNVLLDVLVYPIHRYGLITRTSSKGRTSGAIESIRNSYGGKSYEILMGRWPTSSIKILQ